MNSKPQPAAKKPPKNKERKPPKKITATYLHNSGLYYLQRFAASAGQFREVMLRKVKKSCRAHPDQDFEACAALVDDLIKKFIASGLLNDETYTRGVITSLRRQGKSRQAVLSKLKTKGVADELAREKLKEQDEAQGFESLDAERRAAAILMRKKRLGPFRRNDDKKEKELAVMARAGFSYEIAQKMLDMDLEDAEALITL